MTKKNQSTIELGGYVFKFQYTEQYAIDTIDRYFCNLKDDLYMVLSEVTFNNDNITTVSKKYHFEVIEMQPGTHYSKKTIYSSGKSCELKTIFKKIEKSINVKLKKLKKELQDYEAINFVCQNFNDMFYHEEK